MHVALDIPNLRIGFRPGPPGTSPNKPLPTLTAPTAGRLTLTIARAEVEHALMAYATIAAAEWGVDVNRISVNWTTPNPRTLAVTVDAQAKKGFLGATVRVAGAANLTDGLDLVLHNLNATGEGMAGSFVAPMIQAKLREHENRAIPLGQHVPPYLTVNSASLVAQPDRLILTADVTARDPFA